MNDRQSGLNQIAEHLHHPIPTLHTFRILTNNPRLHTVELPSGVRNAFVIHSKKLDLEGISSLTLLFPKVLCKIFPYVTELTLRTNKRVPIQTTGLLDTLERLPTLERVSLTFGSDWIHDPHPRMITLPLVREMNISALERDNACIPPILQTHHAPKTQFTPHTNSTTNIGINLSYLPRRPFWRVLAEPNLPPRATDWYGYDGS